MPDPQCYGCMEKAHDSGAFRPSCITCGRCPNNVSEFPGKDEIDTWYSPSQQ